jgi:predicted CXXCH cytochrome family protein
MRPGTLTIALITLLAGGAYAAKDSCFECHTVIEGMSVTFKDDVHYHNAISCADCHGGDANEDDQNVSMNASRGFKVRVTRQATPEYCGRCHSDAAFMHKHNPRQRVDQLALYRTSVHGQRLAAGDVRSAECVDCHSVHNIRAASDQLSTTNPLHVVDTCAKCHGAVADLFRKSPHGPVFTSQQMAGCTACHASHATKPAGANMLTGKQAVCASCHEAGSAGGKAAAEMARLVARLEAAAQRANQVLARARQSGDGVADAQSRQQTASENLAQVRLAVHAFNVAAVERAAGPAVAGSQTGRK